MAGGSKRDLSEIKIGLRARVNANRAKTGWMSVCSQTLTRFRAQFQEYYPPLLLACCIGYAVYFALSWMDGKIAMPPSYASVLEPAGATGQRLLYLLLKTSIWSVQVCLPWLLFTFALASVAIKMLYERENPGQTMRIAECFRRAVSSRLGSLVSISLLAGMATAAFSMFFLPLLLRPVPLILFRLEISTTTSLSVLQWATAALVLVLAALLTKMALAIPELVDDSNASIWQSFRNSLRVTMGWEGFFIALFATLTLIGGGVYSAGRDLLQETSRHTQLREEGYAMLQAALSVTLGNLLLTLLAITYSLLYLTLRYDTGDKEQIHHANTAN